MDNLGLLLSKDVNINIKGRTVRLPTIQDIIDLGGENVFLTVMGFFRPNDMSEEGYIEAFRVMMQDCAEESFKKLLLQFFLKLFFNSDCIINTEESIIEIVGDVKAAPIYIYGSNFQTFAEML